MHTALIADNAWLADELGMFRFLVVGLLGEQVRVAQVVPEGTGESVTSAFGARLTWQDRRHDLLRRHQLAGLVPALDELQVGVLHALDGRVWSGALKIARKLQVPVVLNLASAADLDRLVPLRRQLSGMRAGFAAATTVLAEAAQPMVPESVPVELVAPGAQVPPAPNVAPGDRSLCIVITGDGTFDDDVRALLEALAVFVADEPDALLFLDCPGRDTRDLWQAVQQYGLLHQASMIPSNTDHRRLLIGAHLLIQPQALGRARSMTLQAMACGIPVMAREDPWLDYLIDGETAWVTAKSDVSTWLEMIRRHDGPAARRLTESARDWVRRHHLAARLVDRTVDLYRKLTGEAYRFPDG